MSRLEGPADRRLRKINAVVTRSDCCRQMGSERRIGTPDFAQAEFDSFVHRQPRALDMGSRLAIFAVLCDRSHQFRREKIEFGLKPFCSPHIIQLLCLIHLFSQLLNSPAVFGLRLTIQSYTRIAEM